MKTKLTLTIDQSIIEQAKEYAKNSGISLSQLVQNLLKKATNKDDSQLKEPESKYSKFAGIIKSDLDPVKDRDKIRDIRIEKHLK